MKSYKKESWIHPYLETRPSAIDGNGLFSTRGLPKDSVLVIFGGIILRQSDIQKGKFKKHSITGISENLWLGDPPDAPDSPDNYINHSCNPNLWMKDEVTLTSRYDILPNEELTVDYAMWIPDEDWIMKSECRCKTVYCRHVITGRDWRQPKLQKRYYGHFSPFLNRRIETLHSNSY